MPWLTAFNWNTSSNITIEQALKMREGNDPRAGDLWCHPECYENGTGERLLSRKCFERQSHFARWPGAPTGESSPCATYRRSQSIRESMNYANFYQNMANYLEGLAGNENDDFQILEVTRGSRSTDADFILVHADAHKHNVAETTVIILDENKRRAREFRNSYVRLHKGRFQFQIVIRISEYTSQQLLDFGRGGIDKFTSAWGRLVADSHKMLKREHHRRAETEVEDRETEIEVYSELPLDYLYALLYGSNGSNNAEAVDDSLIESAIKTKLETEHRGLIERLQKKHRDIADWQRRLHFDPEALGESIKNAETEVLLLEQEIARVEAEMERWGV